MLSNSEVSFYVDTLLVETILSDDKFHKTAGFVGDVLEKVKSELGAHIRKDHAVEDVLKVLAPGALWVFMQSIGLGKWGFLLGLLVDVFHIDIPGMIKSLYEMVKEMISGGQKVSSAQIDAATQQVAQQYSKSGGEEEAKEGYQNLQKKQQESASKADDHKVYSSLELLESAHLFRLALIDYEHQKMRLTKSAISMPSFLGGYSNSKAKGGSLLAKILGWIFKIVLFSGGLMVAGDVVNSLLGRPSGLSGTYQAGRDDTNPLGPGGSSSAPTPPSGPTSTQTKFPSKGDGPLPASWPLVNNPTNIENMIIQFAKDVYSGLDGKENLIRSTPAFQAIKENIVWFNIHNEGSAQIFLPRNFTSKKNIVDYFIDDVAKGA
jgi:hypothetical protein